MKFFSRSLSSSLPASRPTPLTTVNASDPAPRLDVAIPWGGLVETNLPEHRIAHRPKLAQPLVVNFVKQVSDVRMQTNHVPTFNLAQRTITSPPKPMSDASTQIPLPLELKDMPDDIRHEVMDRVMHDALQPGATARDFAAVLNFALTHRESANWYRPDMAVLNVVQHGTTADHVRDLVGTPAAPGPLAQMTAAKQEKFIPALLRRYDNPEFHMTQQAGAIIALQGAIAALPLASQARILAQALRVPDATQSMWFMGLLGGEKNPGPGTVQTLPPELRVGPLESAVHSVFSPEGRGIPRISTCQKSVAKAVHALPAGVGDHLKPLVQRIGALV